MRRDARSNIGAAVAVRDPAIAETRPTLGEHAMVGLGLVMLVAFIDIMAGSAISPTGVAWYDALVKPTWLPSLVTLFLGFTVVQLSLVAAAWGAWASNSEAMDRMAAFSAITRVVLVSAIWPWAFFAAKSPLLGLVALVIAFEAAVASHRSFARMGSLPRACLVPYGLWLALAILANGVVWWMNA